jgi:hypothetical protein
MEKLTPTNGSAVVTAQGVDFGEVAIPNGAKFPDVYSFPAMTEKNISSSLSYMFDNNAHIKEIILPADGSIIANMANIASNCPNLERIVFPTDLSNVKWINNALYYAGTTNGIKKVVIPSLPNSMAVYSMFAHSGVEEVYMGDIGTAGVGHSGIYMFVNCKRLKKVTLGDVSKLNDVSWFFSGATALEHISVRALPAVTFADSGLHTCSKLTPQSYANIIAALPSVSKEEGLSICFNSKFEEYKELSSTYKAYDVVSGKELTLNLTDWVSQRNGWTFTTK